MERRKPRASVDQESLVKAAAWAWYQHGSGSSDTKSVREFDQSSGAKRVPEPSRFKLEAMKTAAKVQSSEKLFDHHSSSDISDLFDEYEIGRISKQLDYYIEASHAKFYGGLMIPRVHGNSRKIWSLSEDEANSDHHTSAMKSSNDQIKKMKKPIPKGFWLNYSLVCGSRPDAVVDSRRRTKLDGGSRSSGKRGTVAAEVANLKPRGIRA